MVLPGSSADSSALAPSPVERWIVLPLVDVPLASPQRTTNSARRFFECANATQHGAALTASNGLEGGACFVLTLPLVGGPPASPRVRYPAAMSNAHDGLYLAEISLHGLIRGNDLELGRDADTGGQTRYVVELARAAAEQPGVARVELFTRRIEDPSVSDDYAQPVEALGERAAIVRLDDGSPEYLPKEKLWDLADGYVDAMVAHLQAQDRMPDVLHSHYADAGYVGARVSHILGIPLLHTGHSLGASSAAG